MAFAFLRDYWLSAIDAELRYWMLLKAIFRYSIIFLRRHADYAAFATDLISILSLPPCRYAFVSR